MKVVEVEFPLQYYISPQRLQVAKFSSVSLVISAKIGYQLPGFGTGVVGSAYRRADFIRGY